VYNPTGWGGTNSSCPWCIQSYAAFWSWTIEYSNGSFPAVQQEVYSSRDSILEQSTSGSRTGTQSTSDIS